MRPRMSTIRVEIPRCPKCQSTDRTAYRHINRIPLRDETGNVRSIHLERYTTCKQCGEPRKEVAVEIPAKGEEIMD